MKRISLIIMAVLCCGYSTAQTTRQKWEDTVNYVACKYVLAYIENEGNTDDKAKFKGNGGWETLKNSCALGKALNAKRLERILGTDGCYADTYTTFAKPILDRKDSVDHNLKSLLDLSFSQHKDEPHMKGCHDALYKELTGEGEVKGKNTSPPDPPKTADEKDSTEEDESGTDWLMIIAFVLIIVEGVAIVSLWKRPQMTEDGVKNLCANSNRVRKTIDEMIDDSLKQVDRKMDGLSKENDNIKADVARLRKALESGNAQQSSAPSSPKSQPGQSSQGNVIYAKVFGENQLKECSASEQKYYKLYLNSGNPNTANFEFCGDDANAKSKALSNLNVNIKQVCEIEGGIPENGEKTIVTVTRGQANLEGNVWVVKQKARVKFS